MGTCNRVYFDGGKETIGIVGVNACDKVEFAFGERSENYNTNNLAEILAAKWAVE